MLDGKEIKGRFMYEQKNKQFNRFKVETDTGIVQTIYIPKDKQSMPKKLILEYAN
jgi:hypothetical protein